MSTDWLSAIGILLAGLVVGFMFVYASMRRKQEAAAHDDLDRRDLEAKRDALIAQLRAGDLAPEERTRIEREAAEVLRALDVIPSVSEGPGRAGSGSTPASATPRSSSALSGFLWGAGSVVAIVLIAWFVTKNATPKEQQPSAPMQAAAASANDPLPELEANVKSNPDNADARIALAKAYLDRENLMGVFEQTTAVLAKNPNDARAQTYQAIVRIAMGQKDQAQKLLDAATSSDPKLVDAWVALAYLRMQQSDREGAERAIEEGVKQRPDEEQRLRGIFAQMEQQRSSGGQAPSPVQPAQQSAPPSGPSVHVTIALANGTRPNGVLYVMARDESAPAGPPAAVRRVEFTTFPISVDLTAADSMMGQPLPQKMRVEARLDADGNVMTKDPADPKASQDNVALGASVTLTLR